MDEMFATGPPIIILGGKTGSGKTELLHRLAATGEQIVDLEGLAQHKGSAFGNLDGSSQPSNGSFQATLQTTWLDLKPEKHVWLEEEGPFIGQVSIPHALYARMLAAPMIEIELPFALRLQHILEEYGDAPPQAFEAAIQSLASRMGVHENQGILHQYRAGKKSAAFQRLLAYYDSAYIHRREKYRTGPTVSLALSENRSQEVLPLLLAAARQFT